MKRETLVHQRSQTYITLLRKTIAKLTFRGLVHRSRHFVHYRQLLRSFNYTIPYGCAVKILKAKCLANFMELLHPRLPTDEATKSIFADTAAADALHCSISGSFLSSICNKTAVLFIENKTARCYERNIERDSSKQF